MENGQVKTEWFSSPVALWIVSVITFFTKAKLELLMFSVAAQKAMTKTLQMVVMIRVVGMLFIFSRWAAPADDLAITKIRDLSFSVFIVMMDRPFSRTYHWSALCWYKRANHHVPFHPTEMTTHSGPPYPQLRCMTIDRRPVTVQYRPKDALWACSARSNSLLLHISITGCNIVDQSYRLASFNL